MEMDLNGMLADQLDWRWRAHPRPRLDGLTETELEHLDAAYGRWLAGVRGLAADGLARPCGPAESPYDAQPLATLVLHINREAIHHGAEIALLRDLYLRRDEQRPPGAADRAPGVSLEPAHHGEVR